MSEIVVVPGDGPQNRPGAAGPQTSKAKSKPKTDIMSKRNRWYARLWRFIRATWYWPALAYLLYEMWVSPEVLNVVLIIGSLILRIALVLFMAIIQFVAIFWFMARSKVETIKPEDPKSITFKDYWGQPTLVRLVKQWISLLSDREQFVRMGGRYINGILLYGPPGTGKCVTGDTRIITPWGYHRLDEIHPARTPDSYWLLNVPVGTVDGVKTASHFYVGGKSKTLRVTTYHGYELEGTPEHPVLCLRPGGQLEWVQLSQLTTDDYVGIARNVEMWGPRHIEDAYLLGILVGDGHVVSGRRVELSTADPEIAQKFKAWAEANGWTAHKAPAEHDWYLSSAEAVRHVNQMGLAAVLAQDKVVPATLWRSDRDSVRDFLRGLFDADGHADKDSGYIELSLSSHQLVKDVQLLLLKFGILCRVTRRRVFHRHKGIRKQSIAWRLTMAGQHAALFYERVGFGLKRKQERQARLTTTPNPNDDTIPNIGPLLEGWQPRYAREERRPTYPMLERAVAEAGLQQPTLQWLLEKRPIWSRVEGLTPGEAEVFDITVPEGHAFVANGFISHNTMLAKAMAGEAGIPFISIEGSGFRAMFWGVDVLKMMWFCGKAKKLAREYGACFVPETRIYTHDGLKRISDIQVSDYVLSHTGRWRAVTQTMVREVDEDIYELHVMNRREPVRVTGEHPLLVVRTRGRPDMVRRGLELSPDVAARPRWIRVKDLQEGDFVAFPLVRVETSYTGELPEEIAQDPHVARLIGYWLAEGWVNQYQGGYKIEMAFSAEETDYLDDVANIAQQLGHTSWRRRDGSATRIIFSDAKLARFLLENFGSGAEGKRLPEFIFSMPEGWREQLVLGWVRGDGTHAPARRSWSVATVSEDLGHQAVRLFHSMGMSPRLSYRDNRQKRARFPDGREYSIRDLWEIVITGRDYDAMCEIQGIEGRTGNRSWVSSWMDENYVYHPIKSIQRVRYSGPVHNMEVEEDHSYCTPLVAAHNCIAYIDEIDAVAMSRGNVMGGQGGGMMGMGGFFGGGSGSLTRLLYEMDGIGDQTRTERWIGRIYKLFGKAPPPRNWHVLYMGSTNRPDVLDPALLRPGRFDQKIVVDTPDKAGRREIIRGYLSKIKYDETVNIEAIVEDTPNATPAQIAAAITKDAVRIALFNGRTAISQHDIDIALQEQRMGIEQPIEEWDEEQRRQVAYHEAGHAVAQHYLMPEQRIVRVSIVRRGGALGYMLPVDRVEVYAAPLRRFAADIMVAMAGHVATKLHMGEYWTGASGDFSMIRRNIWALYSLGYFGPPVRGLENSLTGGIPAGADPLIERFWKVLEDQTEQLLRQHADEVEAIAQALLAKSDLSHDELMALVGDNGWREPKALRPAREPARLPQPARMPLPAPAAAAVAYGEATEMAEPVVDPLEDTQPRQRVPRPESQDGPTADTASTSTSLAQDDQEVRPDTPPAHRPARMVPPPRPMGRRKPDGSEAGSGAKQPASPEDAPKEPPPAEHESENAPGS